MTKKCDPKNKKEGKGTKKHDQKRGEREAGNDENAFDSFAFG